MSGSFFLVADSEERLLNFESCSEILHFLFFFFFFLPTFRRLQLAKVTDAIQDKSEHGTSWLLYAFSTDCAAESWLRRPPRRCKRGISHAEHITYIRANYRRPANYTRPLTFYLAARFNDSDCLSANTCYETQISKKTSLKEMKRRGASEHQ